MQLSTRFWTLIVLSLIGLAGCASGPAFDPVTSEPLPLDPPATNVELTIMSNGARIPGYLMLAGGFGPHPTALLLHGYPGNEKNLDIAQTLRRDGWNVLFIHYRGAWGAEGRFRISHMHEDALAALGFLRANAGDYRVDTARLAVVGHSMGGFAAMRTLAADDGLICGIGLAAANLGAYADRGPEARAAFSNYSDGLFMLDGWDGATALSELQLQQDAFQLGRLGPALAGRPVLLVTGTEDAVVPVDVQRDLVEQWSADDGGRRVDAVEMAGDHSFSGHRLALQRRVVDWLQGACLSTL